MLELLAPSETMGDVTFDFVGAGMPQSTGDHLYVRKSAALADRYRELAAEFPRGRVVELGMDQGASLAWFSCLWPGGRVAGFDIGEGSVALDSFLTTAEVGRGECVARWGVDQADGGRIVNELTTHWDDELLDVVVDDASHRFDPTLTSFQWLFPRLRPGGVYLIEDWAWELQLEQGMIEQSVDLSSAQAAEAAAREDRPMAAIAALVCLLTGSHPEVAPNIRVSRGWLEVTRGSGALPTPVDLQKLLGPTALTSLGAAAGTPR